jgi:hypothetical protein
MTWRSTVTLIVITKGNGLKNTLSPMISSASTTVRRVIKPLIVRPSRRLRNYNRNANANKMTTLVQTLHK